MPPAARHDSRLRPPTRATTAALALLAALITSALAPADARAQRGEAFVEQHARPPTAMSGFPGLLDTEVVGEGGLVVDLPLLSIDYGVTKNLSVGTYAVAMLPLLTGQPAFVGKTRYRLFSNGRIVSVLDAIGGYVSVTTEDEDGEGETTARLGAAVLGSNTSIDLGHGHALIGTLLAAHARLSTDGAERGDDQGGSLTAVALALSYQVALGRRFGLRLSAITAPLITGGIESDFQAVDFELGGTTGLIDRTFYRALLGVRLGTFMLSGGAVVTHQPSALPWLSLAKRW